MEVGFWVLVARRGSVKLEKVGDGGRGQGNDGESGVKGFATPTGVGGVAVELLTKPGEIVFRGGDGVELMERGFNGGSVVNEGGGIAEKGEKLKGFNFG